MSNRGEQGGDRVPAGGSAVLPRQSALPQRVCLLVLGMHRSGTSALTRVLSYLGCDLPKTLIGANKTNEPGHWESVLLARLNDQILASAGTNWHDWLELNPGWFRSQKAIEFRAEARASLQEEFGSSRLFVLKDPRICRIAPFWLEVLREAGATPLVILPIRNPLEVAASLEERNGFDPAFGHLLWLRHVLDAEFASRGVPRIFSNYDRLLKGWSQIAADAETALGISWPRPSNEVAAEIDDFVSERYRHHQVAPERVIGNPLLASWLRDTFRIVDDWAVTGEREEDFACLDRIRTEFTAAGPAFGQLITAGQKSAEKSRSLEKSLADAQAKLQKADAALGEGGKTVKRLQAELVKKGAEADERARSLENGLADARAKLQKADAALDEGGKTVKRLQADLVKKSAEADKTIAELGDRLGQAECALQKRRVEADEMAAELAAAREELVQKAAAADQTCAEKRELERSLKERFDEIATLTQLLLRQKEALRRSPQARLKRGASMLLTPRRWPQLWDRLNLAREGAALRRSGLFDAEWYLTTYPDVAAANVDPLRHYIEFGAAEGRKPSASAAPGARAGRWN